MKELILRTLTGVSLIIVVAGSILTGPVPFLIVVLLIYGFGTKELFSLGSPGQKTPRMVMAFSAGLLLIITYAVVEWHWSLFFMLFPLLGWFTGLLWSGVNRTGILVFVWLSLPLSTYYGLGWINERETYHSLIPLSVVVLVWVNDTFAYVVGSLAGRHKLTPQLSPGKTWEGFLGGIGFTMLAGILVYRISGSFAPWAWILMALITSSLGLLGDLYESSLKRQLKVKDTGGILPGHGGVLDRFDSLLFVAPALFCFLVILKLLA